MEDEMSRTVYDPIAICSCGVSLHDSARSVHEQRRHAEVNPATYTYPSAERVLAAGWTPADFTHWPYV